MTHSARQLTASEALGRLSRLLCDNAGSSAGLYRAQFEQQDSVQACQAALAAPGAAAAFTEALQEIDRTPLQLRYCALVAGMVPPHSELATTAVRAFTNMLHDYPAKATGDYLGRYQDELTWHPGIAEAAADKFEQIAPRLPLGEQTRALRAASYVRVVSFLASSGVR